MTHALITDPVTSKPNQTTFSRDNLRHILASLTTGMGYNGYSKYMAALGLDFISERAYYDHCNHIYEIQKQVFKEYQIKVIKLLHTIYKEKAEKDEKDFRLIDKCLPIMVAGDGSYPRRGKYSLECIYFIVDVLTAMPVDVHVVRRCNQCPNRTKLGTECLKGGLFHGQPTDMEQEAAKILFARSKDLGLIYQTLVCDGDATTHSKVKDTYGPNCPVKKGECIAHYFKRLSGHYQTALFDYDSKRITKEGERIKEMIRQYNEDKEKNPALEVPTELLQMSNKQLYQSEYPLRDLRKNIAQRLSNMTMINMHRDRHLGPETMSKGVKSVPRHYSDHSDTSDDRRKELHKYCSNKTCEYLKTPQNERSSNYQPRKPGILGIYKKTTEKRKTEKTHIFTSETQDKLFEKIDRLCASPDMMKRCLEWRFQNMNESLHQRVYNIVRKIYFYNEDRVLFAGQFVCVLTAFGYEHSIYKKFGLTEQQLELFRKTDEKTKTRSLHPYPKHRDKRVYDPNMPNNYSFGPGYANLDDDYAKKTEGLEATIDDVDDSLLAEIMPFPLPDKPPPWRNPYREQDVDDPDEMEDDIDDPDAMPEEESDDGSSKKDKCVNNSINDDEIQDIITDYGHVTDPKLLSDIQAINDDRVRFNEEYREHLESPAKMTKKDMTKKKLETYEQKDKHYARLRVNIIREMVSVHQRIVQAREQEKEAQVTSEATDEDLDQMIFNVNLHKAEQASLITMQMDEEAREEEEKSRARKKEEEEAMEEAIMHNIESIIEHNQSKVTTKGDASKIKGKSQARRNKEQGKSNDRKHEEQCLPESPIGNETTGTVSIQKKKINKEQQGKNKKGKHEEQEGPWRMLDENNEIRPELLEPIEPLQLTYEIKKECKNSQPGRSKKINVEPQQGQNNDAEQQEQPYYEPMDTFTKTFTYSTVPQLTQNNIQLDEQGRGKKRNVRKVESDEGKQKKKIKKEQQGKKRKHEEQPSPTKKMNVEQQDQNNEKLIPPWKIKKEGGKRR